MYGQSTQTYHLLPALIMPCDTNLLLKLETCLNVHLKTLCIEHLAPPPKAGLLNRRRVRDGGPLSENAPVDAFCRKFLTRQVAMQAGHETATAGGKDSRKALCKADKVQREMDPNY
ncbi:hypothetical protein Rhopal_007580-T1 [Rhodotorula paludigena]|uniref:Uncharacterized protein n=1 Tax=Rhodotorula paludigena TaxID=86838 RepID=A0AAV5GW36_9BASI|nr:hypothetical protein Rhopal_007580-T1 [Rhodotorula paludigena]